MEKKPQRVAVIEDDVEVCRLLAGVVKKTEGCQLIGAYHDAESAIAVLPGRRPDVVVTDINLPGMDGVACIRQLAARLPDTRFLVLTVYQDADRIFKKLQVRSRSEAIVKYMGKP
ncbi:MAG: response regulator transcription factor [bacterium]